MTPDNFLALEPLIIARLREVLPPHVYVLSAADLDAVAESTQPTPAVHLLYLGCRPAESRDGFLTFEQTWLTVIVVRNLTDTTSGAAARQDAGPLAMQVVDALHRRKFPPARPLLPVKAPNAGFSAGHFYLPLAWTASISFRSDTCE